MLHLPFEHSVPHGCPQRQLHIFRSRKVCQELRQVYQLIVFLGRVHIINSQGDTVEDVETVGGHLGLHNHGVIDRPCPVQEEVVVFDTEGCGVEDRVIAVEPVFEVLPMALDVVEDAAAGGVIPVAEGDQFVFLGQIFEKLVEVRAQFDVNLPEWDREGTEPRETPELASGISASDPGNGSAATFTITSSSPIISVFLSTP